MSFAESLSYLVEENFLFEAVRLAKQTNPYITIPELLRTIVFPKINLPPYNHEHYMAMLGRWWNVEEEKLIQLAWNDFPSNDDEDSNVSVPYRITINNLTVFVKRIFISRQIANYIKIFYRML